MFKALFYIGLLFIISSIICWCLKVIWSLVLVLTLVGLFCLVITSIKDKLL